MKCLIADRFEKEGLARLGALGLELTYSPGLKDQDLRDAIARVDPEILVVRGAKVTAPMIEAGPSLGLIVRAGAGYNTIDVACASARGVYVSNCPGKNAAAVAELAFGLMLSLDRQIPDNVADLRAGRWNKKRYSEARGLKGRTLGLIGMGGIGTEMAARARGFDMPVVAWSRSLTDASAAELGVRRMVSVEAVAEACDVLSVHVALAPETTGLISASVIARLRPGAYFINTSRGEVVDHAALAAAVREKGLRVGLDVFANEPAGATGTFQDDIVTLPGVYGTHHIGASTEQAQMAIAMETARIVEGYVTTGDVPNCVNLCARRSAKVLLVVRHRNRPGVLAHVLGEISKVRINVEEMENIIFSDAQAACAKIRLNSPPDDETLQRIRTGHEHVLAVSLT